MTKIFCINCGDECSSIEETFSYAGTHCNHGRDGVHHTGEYVSDCCLDGTTTVDLSKWTISQHPSMNYGVNFIRPEDHEKGYACSYQDAIRQIIEIEGD